MLFVISRYPDIVDTTIEQTLSPEAYVSDELTARDIFYREVSAVHQFLPTLVNNASDVTQSERPIQQVAHYIMQVNAVLLVSTSPTGDFSNKIDKNNVKLHY